MTAAFDMLPVENPAPPPPPAEVVDEKAALRAMVQAAIDEEARRRGLNRRQATILNRLFDGTPVKVFCGDLGIVEKTAKQYCQEVYRAFEVNSRHELVAAVLGRRP